MIRINLHPVVPESRNPGNVSVASFRKAAERVFADPGGLSEREFKIFTRLRFIDNAGARFNVQMLGGGSYFCAVALSLFQKVGKDDLVHQESTYLFDIAAKFGLSLNAIDGADIRFLDQGALRNISTVRIYSGSQTKTFIVAVNRKDVAEKVMGHCRAEHDALIENFMKTDLLPQPFGFTVIDSHGDRLGVQYKEFLPGKDIESFLARISRPHTVGRLLFAVGHSIGKLYGDTGLGSEDAKFPNLIYHLGKIRFCDVCPLTDNPLELMMGFKQLAQEVPDGYLFGFFDGVLSGSPSSRDLLACIKESLLRDEDDKWASEALAKSLDKFEALKRGLPSS